MTTNALDSLIEELDKSLNDLESTRTTILAIRNRVVATNDAIKNVIASTSDSTNDREKSESSSRNGNGEMTIIEAAVDALKSAKSPLKTADLLSRMKEGGHMPGGKDPKRTLYGVLDGYAKRHKHVQKKDRGTWSLIRQAS